VTTNADSGVGFATMLMTVVRPVTGWQRRMMYMGCALLFLMLGFDLMGLLVLYLH
jgi:hypothetical protein